MSNQPQESLDLASSYTWTPETGRKAMQALAVNARDQEELRMFLDMCGLPEPKEIKGRVRKHRKK